jgi:hypothetical protein
MPNPKPNPSNLPSPSWFVATALICIAIIAFGLSVDFARSDNTAYELGKKTHVAMIIALVLHIIFRSRERKLTGWIGFGLIYISFFIATIFATSRYKEQTEILKNDLREVLSNTRSSFTEGKEISNNVEFKSEGNSNQAKASIAIKKSLSYANENRRAYEAELEAIKWNSILQPDRISNDKDLSESRTILTKAKEIINRYKDSTDSIYQKMRDEIINADLDNQYKQGMLKGFDKSIVSSKENANQLWNLELEITVNIEKIINHLHQNRIKWTIKDNQIMFMTAEDNDAYNSKLNAIDQIVEKQHQLQLNQLKRAEDSLK